MVDRNLEFLILRFFLLDINFFRNLPSKFFGHCDSIKFYEFLQKYIKKYKTIPTQRIIDDFDEDIKLLSLEIFSVNVDITEFNFYSDKMYENYVNRELYDLGCFISSGLLVGSGEDLKKNAVMKISGIRNPFNEIGQVKKEFFGDKAKERWETFKDTEKNPDIRKGVPWGIDVFDELTNGAQPNWLICFFAQSKIGKSRTMANLAYHQAVNEKVDVMWIAREMDLEDMWNVFDSRNALVEQTQIREGKLFYDDRKTYLASLKRLERDKPRLFVVDIPFICSTMEIENAIIQYKIERGVFPRIVYLDYANLCVPARSYQTTSERYNFLFLELHEIARKYHITFVTAVQESREKKIGLSHHIVDHVELMINLTKDKIEEFTHSIHFNITESRHTAARKFSVFAYMAVNYIGDRKIKLSTNNEDNENNK